jgi:hypothetical protein
LVTNNNMPFRREERCLRGCLAFEPRWLSHGNWRPVRNEGRRRGGGGYGAYAVFNDILVFAKKKLEKSRNTCQDNWKVLDTICFLDTADLCEKPSLLY